jgi:hypothetical protein
MTEEEVKAYVRETIFTVVMAAVGLFGFWAFVYILFSFE